MPISEVGYVANFIRVEWKSGPTTYTLADCNYGSWQTRQLSTVALLRNGKYNFEQVAQLSQRDRSAG